LSDPTTSRSGLPGTVPLRHSLQLKLFIPVFIGLLLLIAFQTRVVSTTSRQSYLQQNRNVLLIGSRSLRNTLLEELSEGHDGREGLDSTFRRAFEQCAQPEEVGGAFLDLQGRPIAASGIFTDEESPRIPSPARLAENDEFGEFTGFLHESGQWLASVVPVENQISCRQCHSPDFDARGWILLGMPKSTIQETEGAIRRVGIVTAIVLTIVFGGTVWLLVSLHVRRPLGEIAKSMARVMDGKLSARYVPESRDEIGLLGKRYNAMVERLEETDGRLRDANVKLMQRAEKMVNVGEMASRLAHEIRNPLAGLEGVLSVLHEDLPSDNPDRKILEEARNQVHRIDRTVSDILSFARPSAPELAVCDLDETLSPLIEFCRQSAVSGAHRLEYFPGKNVPLVNVDRDQISQAILNLILNAVQAMDGPGEISITTRRTEWGEAEILVRDTGPGIPEDTLPNIFEAFYTTRTKGTGLGLAVSQSILARHNGTLEVSSTGPEGTTFRFVIPPAIPDASQS